MLSASVLSFKEYDRGSLGISVEFQDFGITSGVS